MQHLLTKAERVTLAASCDVAAGKVDVWACSTLADGPTLPAYAIVHMPKAARDEFLRTLGEWGDLNDQGAM